MRRNHATSLPCSWRTATAAAPASESQAGALKEEEAEEAESGPLPPPPLPPPGPQLPCTMVVVVVSTRVVISALDYFGAGSSSVKKFPECAFSTGWTIASRKTPALCNWPASFAPSRMSS